MEPSGTTPGTLFAQLTHYAGFDWSKDRHQIAVVDPAGQLRLEQAIKQTGDEKLLDDWRKLQSSDHFYYMCTKYYADGTVHKYFNPYDTPYDSFINFMNVLDNLRGRLGSAAK